jgi:hypothetical protein
MEVPFWLDVSPRLESYGKFDPYLMLGALHEERLGRYHGQRVSNSRAPSSNALRENLISEVSKLFDLLYQIEVHVEDTY